MAKPALPRDGSQEYLWWSQGATDEARIRNEGMSAGARELRDLLESLARAHNITDAAELAAAMARICCPDRLRRRFR